MIPARLLTAWMLVALLLAACGTARPAQSTDTGPTLTEVQAIGLAYTYSLTRSVPGNHITDFLALWCFRDRERSPVMSKEVAQSLAQATLSAQKWVVATEAGCTFIVDDATGVVAWPQ